ncbi:MAG: family 43 glycosylhydrolase [Lachnospiraceae bacterium]|nr:family 43 glycosylhydrolase [Lachnospiraceae bacterium]
MYYRSENKSVCADVIPFYENGKFYLFYLKDHRDPDGYGIGIPWHLLTTTDLVHYEEHGTVLDRGTTQEQDLAVFTGSCAKFNDEYYIFYTGHNHLLPEKGLAQEVIMMAKSKDCIHWEKVPEFRLEAPDWVEPHDFRDPFVYYDEEKKKYCMLLVGRVKTDIPSNNKGITMILYSDDLWNWTADETPFYAPQAFFAHECPDLFKMGDWWYLLFSEFSDKVATCYRMAKSPNGPWITPKVDTFDGHAYYAAKSTSDGTRRILFGWNPIKNHEKDEEFWQWGGTIIPHEIVQDTDGTLWVKCPEEIKNQYTSPAALSDGFSMNQVTASENGYKIGQNCGRSIQMLGELPTNCKVEMEFTTADEIGDFGVFLRADEKLDKYYLVRFDPRFNRLTFDKMPRKDATIHCHVDVERFCPLIPGKKNTLLMIVEGSVLTVYVNDRIAMSARMFDHESGDIGLYTHNTEVIFENIRIYK